METFAGYGPWPLRTQRSKPPTSHETPRARSLQECATTVRCFCMTRDVSGAIDPPRPDPAHAAPTRRPGRCLCRARAVAEETLAESRVAGAPARDRGRERVPAQEDWVPEPEEATGAAAPATEGPGKGVRAEASARRKWYVTAG